MYLNSRKKYTKTKHIEHLNHKNEKKLSSYRMIEKDGDTSSSDDDVNEIF